MRKGLFEAENGRNMEKVSLHMVGALISCLSRGGLCRKEEVWLGDEATGVERWLAGGYWTAG